MNNEYKQVQATKKSIKRYVITFLCTIPLLFVVGLALGDGVNRAVRMLIFVVILLAVVGVEELIYSKIKKNKPKKVEVEKEDVFK